MPEMMTDTSTVTEENPGSVAVAEDSGESAFDSMFSGMNKDTFASIAESLDDVPKLDDDVSDVVEKDAQPETDGGQQEAEEEEYVSASKYRELLGKHEALLSGRLPESVPNEQEQQAAKPEEKAAQQVATAQMEGVFPAFEVSAELADKIGLIDAAPLNEAITGYVSKAMQHLQQSHGLAVANTLAQAFPFFYVAQGLFDKHPEFEQYPAIVNSAIASVAETHKGLRPREFMTKVEEHLSNVLGKGERIAKANGKVDLRVNKSAAQAPGVVRARKDGQPDRRGMDRTTKSLLEMADSLHPVNFFE